MSGLSGNLLLTVPEGGSSKWLIDQEIIRKKVNQGATLKKVFERLGKYRIFLIFSILLATVSVALTLYIPKLTGHAVDFIISRGNVDFPGVLRVMVQIGICTLVTALAQC